MLLDNKRQYLLYEIYATFYHSNGLTRNKTLSRPIYYVLYLQILRFYLVGQIYRTSTLTSAETIQFFDKTGGLRSLQF